MRLGGPKQRAALALLASRPGAVLSTDNLIHSLWGDEPPKTAATALQGHVSQLRRLLGPDAIVTHGSGYSLALDPDDVDAGRFDRLTERAHNCPPTERVDLLRTALSLWRGAALADVAALADDLHELADRLEETRLAAHEELFEAQIALGRHVDLVAGLEAFVQSEPTRERAVGQLMLVLYRSGRQADALAAFRRFRRELDRTLALEPGLALRDLERQILVHDPALAPPATPRASRPRRLPLTVAAVGLEPAGAGEVELDAEVYAAATGRAREEVRLVFERHGAVVERAGSAVLGLFGLPTPNEDDPARGLAAARNALGAIERLDLRPPVRGRAGVASGDSFGSESAAIEQALRLQAQAEPGAVEIDDLTRSRARPRDLRPDRPLSGRAEERLRLRDLHDAAMQERRSATALLVGPAGIGKTRLAEDLAASVAPETRVLRTRCLAYGDGIGLLPAAELIRGAVDLPDGATADVARAHLLRLLDDDTLTAPAVEQLLGVLGLTDETADAPAGWAVRRLLETLARRSPTLVLVDDLHWAAPVFLEVVERLAEPAEASLFVVVTTRQEPIDRLRAHVSQLDPLEPAACAEIVVELLGGGVEGTALQRLAERSGGNPLFLEALVDDRRASGQLRLDGVWRLDDSAETPPSSIRSLLAARVERLPDRERDLLAVGAVLGRSFTIAALADLADLDDDVDEPVTALFAAGLLQPAPTGGVEFRHELIRDAAYASLPLGLKADLHERVAARVERGAEVGVRDRDALAVHHLDRAYRARAALAPGDPELAGRAAELAARAASLGHTLFARGDASAAVSLLARSVELNPDDSLAAIELGRARFDTGELAAAAEAFSLRATRPSAERARVGLLEVRLHTDPGCDLERIGAEIDGLLVTLRQRGDEHGAIEALLARAYVSLTRGHIAELGAALEDALLSAQGAGRLRAEAEILFLLCGASWFGPTPLADAVRRCERVLGDARDRPIVEAAALQALGVLSAMAGDFECARERVATSRSIRKDIGQELGAAASAIDAGIVELLAADYVAAERVFRSGYAELEHLGETGYFSTLAALLAGAVEAQGRPDEARELAQAAAAAAAGGDVASNVGWRVAEARALARMGAAADAHVLAEAAVELAEGTDFPLLRADAWAACAHVAAARGNGTAADSSHANAIAVLERKGLSRAAVEAWTRLPATGRVEA